MTKDQYNQSTSSMWTDKGIDTYGLFIGRFQPFHIAHEAIIHEIIADGKVPVVVVGGVNKTDDRHFLDFNQVKECIHKVFPELIVLPLEDTKSWDVWYNNLIDLLWSEHITVREYTGNHPLVTLYYNNKPSDISKFSYKGIDIEGCYDSIFKLHGVDTKQVTFPSLLGLTVNATDIRENLKENRHWLDSRVYNYLK